MTRKSGILPWTRSCFVCGQDNAQGLRLRSRVENGLVVIDYTTRDTDRGWRLIIHGGIAMTLLDEVMTWAAILKARRACVAAEISTRLKKPIVVGQRLRIEGEVTDTKSRLMLTEGRILGQDGNALMIANGKYLPMPEDQAELCEKDFVVSEESIPLAEIL